MSEYIPGAKLTARFTPEARDAQVATSPPPSRDLSFTVVKPFTPFTMSAAMQVELDPEDPLCQDHSPDGFVLKLYDRRAVLNMRDELDQGRVHSMEREAEYREFISDPSRVPTKLDGWAVLRHRNDPEHGALVECLLQQSCDRSFKNESQVYRRLWERAGGKPCPAPRFFGQVEIETEIGLIMGILIEYIAPSMSLADFIAQTGVCGGGAGIIAAICDSAMHALSYLHDCEVLNKDARVHNIVVQFFKADLDLSSAAQSQTALVARCVLLDFGQARLRHDDETELEWNRGKTFVNEDQALASDMRYHIRCVWKADCISHGTACKSLIPGQDQDAPVWDYVHVWRFSQRLTDEQVQLACKDPYWGMYESRPYPATMAEYMAKKQMEADRRSVIPNEH